MINCPQCGAANQEKEAYCYRCGTSLKLTTETRQFIEQDEAPVIPKRRWGTARFDRQTTVIFHIRGYDKPVHGIFAENDELVLGRTHDDQPVDVDFTNYGAVDAGVSRRHALLRRQNDTIAIIDLGSANNTYLNGQKIIPNEPRILRDGDEIRLGRLVVRVTFQDDPVP